MATQASSAMALPQAWQPEEFPAGLRLAPADSAPAEQGDNRLRPLEVAECCMCGIERPLGLLVPDGGGACTDIRWYCKDVRVCTERWTAALPDRADGVVMPLSGCVPRRYCPELQIDASRPAFVSWLGVTVYLDETAIEATVSLPGAKPPGSEIVGTTWCRPGCATPRARPTRS
jgi:hypothetical protein